MKKGIILVAMLLLLSSLTAAPARGKSALIEIGPKGSLYISSVRFGIGAEIVFTPFKTVGFRVDVSEISFGDGGTIFYLNQGILFQGVTFDAIIHIPMRGVQPYIHTGIGFSILSNGGSSTYYNIRGGMGFNYVMNRNTNLFIEPGIIILGNGETDVVFRLSFGARFGIL